MSLKYCPHCKQNVNTEQDQKGWICLVGVGYILLVGIWLWKFSDIIVLVSAIVIGLVMCVLFSLIRRCPICKTFTDNLKEPKEVI